MSHETIFYKLYGKCAANLFSDIPGLYYNEFIFPLNFISVKTAKNSKLSILYLVDQKKYVLFSNIWTFQDYLKKKLNSLQSCKIWIFEILFPLKLLGLHPYITKESI